MATATLSKLLEANLAAAISGQSWAGDGVAPVYDSLGAQLITFPSIRVQCDSGAEEPPSSGNFNCGVEIVVNGGLDPDNASDYSDVTDAHTELCGEMENYLTGTLANAALEQEVSGYTNKLQVHDIRFVSFARAIDSSNGVFEDTFTLEIYCHQD